MTRFVCTLIACRCFGLNILTGTNAAITYLSSHFCLSAHGLLFTLHMAGVILLEDLTAIL